MPPNAAAATDEHPHADVIGSALALTAGYIDTLGFVALFGLFTAHVTGNFVLIGSELADPSRGVLVKFLAFPAFIIGVVVARFIVVLAERAGRNAAPLVLIGQALLLTAFMVAGWFALPLEDARSAWALTAGMCGAAAMGIHNAASKLVWGFLSPTTVMTGNVTQLVIDLVDLLRGGGSPELRKRMHKFLWPVIAFGIGAIGGAYAFHCVSFLGLALPIVVILALVPLSAPAPAQPVGSASAKP
jgi:uncharacterized membrane protein YoaK (UPF0700 family)